MGSEKVTTVHARCDQCGREEVGQYSADRLYPEGWCVHEEYKMILPVNWASAQYQWMKPGKWEGTLQVLCPDCRPTPEGPAGE